MKLIDRLVLEKAGVNLDMLKLSKFIYENLDLTKKVNVFKRPDLDLSINIKSVTVHFSDRSYFDITNSSIDIDGFNIIIGLYKEELNEDLVLHELTHALEFYMKGKDKSLKSIQKLKTMPVSNDILKNSDIQDLIDLYYYSSQTELNSYIAESYLYIINKIKEVKSKRDISKSDLKVLFNVLWKETIAYRMATVLENYDFNYLKENNSKELVLFFKMLDDNENKIETIRKDSNIEKFKTVINLLIKNIWSNSYKKRLDRTVQIKNIDYEIKRLDNRFKRASRKIKSKLPKFYDMIETYFFNDSE